VSRISNTVNAERKLRRRNALNAVSLLRPAAEHIDERRQKPGEKAIIESAQEEEAHEYAGDTGKFVGAIGGAGAELGFNPLLAASNTHKLEGELYEQRTDHQ
jgi:hypothetical protein